MELIKPEASDFISSVSSHSEVRQLFSLSLHGSSSLFSQNIFYSL